jgi:hypothetical protein
MQEIIFVSDSLEAACDGSGSIGVDVIGSKRSEAVPRLYGYSL